MAEHAKKLIAGNPSLNERITVSMHSLILVSFKKLLSSKYTPSVSWLLRLLIMFWFSLFYECLGNQRKG